MKKLLQKLRKNKKFAVSLFATAIVGFCSYYLIFNFEWKQIWQVMQRINWLSFFLYSTAIIILYWFIRALRWRILLPIESKILPFIELYFYTVFATSLSSITPFQSGEALKVEMVQRENSSRFSTYAIFAFERALDLLVILILALIGLNKELDSRFSSYIYITLLCLTVSGTAILILIILAPYKKLQELREKLKSTWNLSVIIQAILLTFASWMLVTLGWKLALQQIIVDLTFTQAFVVVSLGAVINVISFVPGAVGVSEISTAQILTLMGYDKGSAQAAALLIRSYMLIGLALAIIQWAFSTKLLNYLKIVQLKNNKAL